MKEKRKLARVGFVALAALGSYGIEKPTKENLNKSPIPEYAHALTLGTESKQSPNPIPVLPHPLLQKEDLLRLKPEISSEIYDQEMTIPSPIETVNHLSETEEYINEQKEQNGEENDPRYKFVDWDSLNLIDKENVKNWEDLILKYANIKDVPPAIIAVTIDTESHGRIDGVWRELPGDGAGLMGIMPNDENNSFPNRPDRETLINNHEVNISYGTAILSEIYRNENQGDSNWFKTFLWYNAGLQDKLKYAISYAKHAYSKLGWEISEDDVAKLMVIEDGTYDIPPSDN